MGNAASYSVAIRLNGVTSNGRCHHCGADVTMQHGSHPDSANWFRHYFRCNACQNIGIMYTLFRCDGCSQVSSDGGEIITYLMPEPERVAVMESGLVGRAQIAQQMSFDFGG